MSDTIHAFGPNGELSRGAQVALEGFASKGYVDSKASLTPVSGAVSLPSVPVGTLLGYRVIGSATFTSAGFSTITLGAGAYILENSPSGWVSRQIDEGSAFTPPSSPILLEDDFEAARADLYGTLTPVGAATWSKGMAVPLGMTLAAMAMQTTGGHAIQTSGIGAAALVATDWLDMSVEVGYDVTAASNAEVTAFSRGDHAYTNADRSQMPVRAKVTGAGNVLFEPYFNGTSWVGFTLGTGAPTTGTLRLDVIGDQASVYVNGSQVGATRTLDSPQLAGAHAGFIVAVGGFATTFSAARV